MLESLLSQLSQSFQTHSLTFFIFAILSVLLVGISKSGFGAGLGTLSLPLLASQVSIAEALAILLPLLIAIDLVGLRRFLRNANWKILSLLLPSAAIGILIGMIFFAVIAPQVLTLCIGIFILLYLLQDLVMSYFESNKAKLSPWLGILLSILSGVTSFVAHNGGPPITAYMRHFFCLLKLRKGRALCLSRLDSVGLSDHLNFNFALCANRSVLRLLFGKTYTG